MAGKIKLGATLYSFSNEFIHGKIDLETILHKVKEMGYEGVEIVTTQMIPEYPYPSDKWLGEFRDLLDKIGLEPVCWSAYIDMGIRTDRDLTEDEIVQFTVNDLIYAKKAGFPMVRTQHAISPAIFRRMIPFCRELGMQLTIEMHHPHHPNVPVWQEYFDLMRGEGKGVLGFVPDMSIFQNRPHLPWLGEALRYGVRTETLERAVALHARGASNEELLSGDLLPIERQYIEEMISEFDGAATVDQLAGMLDCAFYMHGKFYCIDEELREPSIPYDQILPVIRDSDYSGYIACEYEGHHFDSSIDAEQQLRRYIAMCNGVLNP